MPNKTKQRRLAKAKKRKPGAAERDAKRIATSSIRRNKYDGRIIEFIGASGKKYVMVAASYQEAGEIIADLRAAARKRHVAAVRTNNPRTWSPARRKAAGR